MKYAHLGRSGVVVSRLCLGTMNFGPETSEQDSFAMMDAALDAGINFFDSANVYGWKIGEGLTEQIVGRWFAQGGGRREKVVLTTKVCCPMGFGPNDRGLSALHIRRSCDESLQRLKTDHIDVYIWHHIDRGDEGALGKSMWKLPQREMLRPPHLKHETPWDEIWQAMDVLVQQGKIIYAGSSNFAGWNIAQCCERAMQRHSLGPICEQSKYSLNCRAVELEVVPACHEYGLGIIPYSPVGGGLLGGALAKHTAGRRARLDIEPFRKQLEAYEKFCRELGEEPATVALAWLLANPVVTAPIIGPRTMEQLTGSYRAVDLTLDKAAIAKLDEIWPGPGGQAPEAYAW